MAWLLGRPLRSGRTKRRGADSGRGGVPQSGFRGPAARRWWQARTADILVRSVKWPVGVATMIKRPRLAEAPAFPNDRCGRPARQSCRRARSCDRGVQSANDESGWLKTGGLP